jgi:hypothetical protein
MAMNGVAPQTMDSERAMAIAPRLMAMNRTVMNYVTPWTMDSETSTAMNGMAMNGATQQRGQGRTQRDHPRRTQRKGPTKDPTNPWNILYANNPFQYLVRPNIAVRCTPPFLDRDEHLDIDWVPIAPWYHTHLFLLKHNKMGKNTSYVLNMMK